MIFIMLNINSMLIELDIDMKRFLFELEMEF